MMSPYPQAAALSGESLKPEGVQVYRDVVSDKTANAAQQHGLLLQDSMHPLWTPEPAWMVPGCCRV
jgi:hypothetical protein